jgi:RNA polymerase sigma-70 factor (ECF subfamily)
MNRPLQAATASAVQDDDPTHALCERIGRARRGDREALGELFVAFGEMVFQSAYRLTGSTSDAEDVTQDVFVRLPRALGGFAGTSENFGGWMRRIAVRQALTHLRSSRRRREVTVEDVANLFAATDDSVNRLTIESALARLSDEHRLVFLLKEVEGYDHGEIAELLEISIANSEVRLHRARRELRELLRGSR